MIFTRALSPCVLVVGVFVSGCHSMARVSQPNDHGKTIEVRFTPARNIDAVEADGSAHPLAGVASALGTLTRVQGDSLTLSIARWKEADAKTEHVASRGLTATFAAADGAIGYYERRTSWKKSLLLAGTIAGALALAAGQADIGTPGNIGGGY